MTTIRPAVSLLSSYRTLLLCRSLACRCLPPPPTGQRTHVTSPAALSPARPAARSCTTRPPRHRTRPQQQYGSGLQRAAAGVGGSGSDSQPIAAAERNRTRLDVDQTRRQSATDRTLEWASAAAAGCGQWRGRRHGAAVQRQQRERRGCGRGRRAALRGEGALHASRRALCAHIRAPQDEEAAPLRVGVVLAGVSKRGAGARVRM